MRRDALLVSMTKQFRLSKDVDECKLLGLADIARVSHLRFLSQSASYDVASNICIHIACVVNPRSLSQSASHDVASNICRHSPAASSTRI